MCGIACVALPFAGCTVLDLYGGILSDAQKPDEQIFRPVAADSIEMGSHLYLVRTNGATDTVTMAGVERVTPAGSTSECLLRMEQDVGAETIWILIVW